jgi:outer membrane protein OmpA-like peptidoglycan-associated protein
MNRLLLPLLILLGSLLFSWHWNCNRKPYCSSGSEAVLASVDSSSIAIASVDTTQNLTADTTKISPQEKVLFKPLDVYFNTHSAALNRTSEMDEFLSVAKTYLEKNPTEKLIITGHTDSDATSEFNLGLGQKRANSVKNILVKEGFNAENLAVESKGEAEPLAENDTEENKAKNRRVSIRLKN